MKTLYKHYNDFFSPDMEYNHLKNHLKQLRDFRWAEKEHFQFRGHDFGIDMPTQKLTPK